MRTSSAIGPTPAIVPARHEEGRCLPWRDDRFEEPMAGLHGGIQAGPPRPRPKSKRDLSHSGRRHAQGLMRHRSQDQTNVTSRGLSRHPPHLVGRTLLVPAEGLVIAVAGLGDATRRPPRVRVHGVGLRFSQAPRRRAPGRPSPNAAGLAASQKKNDRVDAGKIADLLRCNLLPRSQGGFPGGLSRAPERKT